MKIIADATLPGLDEHFPQPFELSLYHHQDDLAKFLPGQDVLLCRSTLKVTRNLLDNCSLQAVATASSGIDHIDVACLQERNIPLVDAKGSNANSVADYILASLAWLNKNKAFTARKAMVIGMGAVGTVVSRRLQTLGLSVLGFDPLKDNFNSCALTEIKDCDLICLHANLHDNLPHPSRHLLDESVLSLLRPNSALINASRGDIVNESALLHLKTPIYYCTDVYTSEPAINPHIINFATLCTPHIAGHSLEAKMGAVQMVSEKLRQLFGPGLRSSQLATNESPCSPVSLHRIRTTAEQTPDWEEQVLNQYNPIDETQALKLAEDKKAAFLSLRARHQFRHDFEWATPSSNE